MKKLLLAALLIASPVFAGDAIVSWSHPTTYEDGSPLPVSEILGTVIYYGTTAGGPYSSSLSVPAPATTVTITNLAKGNWYFVATSIATNNLESAKSNEVVKSVASNSKPRPPKMN
jgi:hypothetical protein